MLPGPRVGMKTYPSSVLLVSLDDDGVRAARFLSTPAVWSHQYGSSSMGLACLSYFEFAQSQRWYFVGLCDFCYPLIRQVRTSSSFKPP
jgi:hypothetical protein